MSSSSQSSDSNTGVIYAVGNAEIVGEVEPGERYDITHPIPIQATRYEPIMDISSSNFHTLALNEEGQIWSWGRNEYGAVGRQDNPSRPELITHVSIKYTKFIKVACGDSISMALSSKGLLHTWGTFITEEDEVIGYLPTQTIQTYPRIVNSLAKLNITDIAAGASHCLALSDTGQVYSWGCGDQSQLGRPYRTPEESILPGLITDLENITSITCGKYHSFAISRQGQVFAWGLNQFQQCGLVQKEVNGATIFGDPLVDKPTLVPYFSNVYKIRSISAGENHSIGLMNDNSLVVFGRCDSGQLGIVIYDSYNIWGSMRTKETNKTYVIGYPVKNLWRCEEKIVKIVCGANHTLILTDNGVAYGFGDSSHCQLGIYGRENINFPTPLSSLSNQKYLSSSSSKNNAYVFEQQNDVRLNDLSSKISAIKNITIDIHQDVTDQDRLLDESHNQFSGLGSTMSNSFGRMNRMISKRHQRQLCFYVSIIVFVFFLIYYGAPLAKGAFGSNPKNPDDDTL